MLLAPSPLQLCLCLLPVKLHLCVFPEELCLTRNLWKACNIHIICGKHVTYELFTLVWRANSPSGAVKAALKSSFGDTPNSELRFNGGGNEQLAVVTAHLGLPKGICFCQSDLHFLSELSTVGSRHHCIFISECQH